MAYHVRHAAEWVIRLGDGTEESHARAAAALDELWMYTGELFEMDEGERALVAAGHCRRPRSDQAGLGRDRSIACWPRRPCSARPTAGCRRGGRSGRHSEHLGHLLAEMQVLHRAHPGATW